MFVYYISFDFALAICLVDSGLILAFHLYAVCIVLYYVAALYNKYIIRGLCYVIFRTKTQN